MERMGGCGGHRTRSPSRRWVLWTWMGVLGCVPLVHLFISYLPNASLMLSDRSARINHGVPSYVRQWGDRNERSVACSLLSNNELHHHPALAPP